MRRLLARLLLCDPGDLGNVLMHIPVGVVNVLLPVALHYSLPAVFTPLGAAAIALLFGYGFVKYQRVEAEAISDRCYPDLQGWLEGMIFCSFGMAIVRLLWFS